MPVRVVVEGEGEWEFPDDASDGEIATTINREKGLGPRGVPEFAGRPAGFEPKTRGPLLAALPAQAPRPVPGLEATGFGAEAAPQNPFMNQPVGPPAGGSPTRVSLPPGPLPPAGGAALPPQVSPLREAMLARRQAAGGAPLASLGPEAVQAAGAAAQPIPTNQPLPGLAPVTRPVTAFGAEAARATPGAVAGLARFLPEMQDQLRRGGMDLVADATGMTPEQRQAAQIASQATLETVAKILPGLAPGGMARAGRALDNKVVAPVEQFLGKLGPAKRVAEKRETLTTGQKLRDPEMWGATMGNAVPSLAAMAVAQALGVPLLPVAAAMEGGGALREIEAHEAETGEKVNPFRKVGAAALVGIVNGTLEKFGFERGILKLSSLLPKASRSGFRRAAVQAVQGGIGEGGTETTQEFTSNVVSKLLIDPERKLTEGLVEAGMGGAGAGFLMGGGRGAGVVSRGERIAKARAAREAWEAENRPAPPMPEAPAPAPPAGADADIERWRTEGEALDARLQGLREPGATRAPEAAAFDPEGRRVVPPATVDAINEGVRDLLRPETANERSARPSEATAAPVRRSELPSGGAESPLGAGPGAVTKTPRLEAESASPEGEDGEARGTEGDSPYARGREAFRNRFGEDAPGLDRFLTLAEMVRQEAPDASHEEAHEAALILLEEERRFAPRGAEVDARAGATHSRDARGVGALAEGTSRTPGAPREGLASRAVARSVSRDPNPRARGIPVRELAAAVARAEETWPAAPAIAVVRDESELPLEVQEVLGGAKVRGIYHGGRHGDPSSGTVFLLADRVSSVAEAFETLVHELVGHAGVMAVLGPRAWKETVRGVLESREGRRLVAEWMDGHGEPYAFDLATEGGREGAVAETLAWIAERRLASPTYSPPTFYRRVLAKVRLWLRGIGRRFGVTPDALAWNEEDIDALLASAARRFEGGERVEGSGTWLSRAPENGGADGNPTLSDAQRRRVAELVSRTRERLAETDPRWRALGEDLAGEGRQRQDSPALEDGDQTNPDAPSREEARPDLANPGLEKEGRRLVERVDSARTEAGEPARRADAEVNAEADRRLEADWEGERRALLSRGRQGAGLDDVETVAAKKIISAEAFAAMKALDVETLAETAELIDAYRRTGTAQAQAFRQRRDEVRNPRERMAAFVAESVLRPGEETSEKVRTGTPAQRREALKRHGEQAKAVLEKLRDRGIDVANLSDEDLADRFLVARVVREVAAARADLSDKVFEYWSNAILSGPLTHIANVTGNTVSLAVEYALQQPLEMALGAAAGGSRSLAEARALYGGLWRGIVRGARNAVEAFDTEQRALGEKGDLLAPDRLEARVAIGGKPGRVIRLPYRYLRASDEFFRGVIGQMEAQASAHGIARREGLAGQEFADRVEALLENGDSAAWQDATLRADLLTFQSQLGKYGQLILSARRTTPGMRYILPFVTTPANIFKTALRKSPAGAVGSLYSAARGELSRDQAIRAGAEQLIGLGVIAMIASALGDDDDEPIITGTVPFRGSAKGERPLAERTTPPMSIRMGGKWYSYSRLEPVATWVGLTVDLMRGAREAQAGKDLGAVTATSLKRFVGQLEDKTFLDGIGRIVRALDEGKSFGRIVGDVAGGFVPAVARQAGAALEPTVRESRTWGAGFSPKHEGEGGLSRLARRSAERAAPFAVKGTPKVTSYGTDVAKANQSFLGRFLSPVQAFDPKSVPDDVRRIDEAFARWNRENPDATYYPPLPEPRYTKGGKTHYLADKEYERFLRQAGMVARRRLSGLVQSAGGRLEQRHIDRAKRIFSEAADAARARLRNERGSAAGGAR
jgi:hypothetical protein